MKIQRILMIVLLLLLLMFTPSSIIANSDTIVDLRLYKGAYQNPVTEPVSITTTYYLKPMVPRTLILNPAAKEEMLEIKKVFNLLDLKLITQARWGWEQRKKSKQYQTISLDDRELLFELIPLEKIDHFRLEVTEKEKKLMEAEIILPQERTSVFGFENSAGNPYFISLQRQKDEKIPGEKSSMAASIKRPRLIKKVNPEFPQKAKDQGIGGKVILECTTSKDGTIQKVEVLEGHPILSQAAIDAVKQWIYEPYYINDQPQKITFTVEINFRLEKKAKEEPDTSLEKIPKNKNSLSPEQLISNLKNKNYIGEPMNFEFNNVELDKVLNLFSTITNLQIQNEKHIDEKITCKFKETPWDKALANFLKDNQLELVLDGNRLKVIKSKNN